MFFISSLFSKTIMPKTLLARFMLIIIIPTLIGQLIAVSIFYKKHWYNVSDRTSKIIVEEISSLLDNIDYADRPYHKHNYLNLTYSYLPNTKISSARHQFKEFRIFENTLQEKISYPAGIILNENNEVNLLLQINEDLLEISLPPKSVLNPTTYIFVLWMLSLTVLLLGVSLIFSKNQIKSILELTKAAEKYGRGEAYNYKPSGATEIRKAGLAFLKMKERIERQVAQRTKMLAMISHDLKTPLTRMKLQVELMQPSEEKEELQHDVDSMQNMVTSYLDFTRGEGGEKFIQVEINSWIEKYLAGKWKKENIEFVPNKREVITKVKPHSFARAMANVISNGLKYSTEIKISINFTDENVLILIEDNGIGIDPKERQNAFKPFYRCDNSRTLDSSSNVGLGLAITQEIITGHYGTVILDESQELKGLLVKIQLPRITHNQKYGT